MFSKTFGYALRSVIFISLHGKADRKISLLELSNELEIPHHFLGKVMQDMVRHGILDSIKGPNGGFFPNADTEKTPILDILKITDGSLIFTQCALNIKKCNSQHPCPLHHEFGACRDGMLNSMAGKTVGSLAEMVDSGLAFLGR